MPRKVTDYSRTIIYKIQHQDKEDLLYVGSTTDFTKRKYRHKSNCKTSSKYNIKLYKTIRDNGGWDCFRMIEIKKFPCNDKREAEAEEDRIMCEMKATMNSQRGYMGLTKKEYDKQYKIDNWDKIIKKKNEYRIDNRIKIREYDKQKINCECGCVVTKTNLKRHKEAKKHLDLMMLKKN